MSDMNSANDQMLEMFLFEMTSLLEQLDEILLASEKNQSLTGDDVNEVFRIMHTIKGSSAMMEFNTISAVTHKLEDCFFLIRENGINESHFTGLFDLMLDATDYLKSQLEEIQSGERPQQGNDELVARAAALYAVLSGKETTAAPEKPAAAPAKPEAEQSVSESFSGSGSAYHAEVFFDEDCGMENLRAFMLVESLGKICTVTSYEPPDVETNPETASAILVQGFSLRIMSDLDADSLQTFIEEVPNVKTALVVPAPDDSEIQNSGNISGDTYSAHVFFEEDCGMENLRAFMLLNSLRATCRIISCEPSNIESDAAAADLIHRNGFGFVLETPTSEDTLLKTLRGSMHVRDVHIEQLEKREEKPGAKAAESAPKASSTPADSEPVEQAAKPSAGGGGKPIKQNLINVNLSKLDELMDLMGELVITESMVTRSPDLKEIAHLDNFNKSARQLRKLTNELQDMVMSIRMIPIAGTFQKMTRIVRDMCRNLGKEADLVTMGEETDIDKTIIDGIADPIMHLVRNAMDHGVETPEERLAAGKSPKATVTLSAQNTGGEILITVSDDGKGLDAEKLLAKAKENGILTKAPSEYTEKEAFQLLMAPGFSTKEKVTEYSGRGVGMDVVKKNVEKIGGTVVVESRKGQGMSVFLKIPLTLAIVDGMNLSVGDGVYTVQITSINESFKATREQIITDTDGNEMIMIRGNVYPIIRLYELYSIPNAITNIEDGILILAQSGEQSACLFVDQLIGMQQIVVKSMPVYLNRYDIKPYGISGYTILGDGNISLILDVGSVIDKVMEKR